MTQSGHTRLGNRNLKSIYWKDIAELVGIAAIVASLVFVGMQMRQEQEIATVDTRGSVTASMTGITESLKGSGDIWKKGLDGTPLTDAEQIEFRALVETVESHMFMEWVRFFRLGPANPEGVAQRYAFAIYSHPGLRIAREEAQVYSRARNDAFGVPGGGSGFDQMVDKFLAKLDSDKPQIGDQKIYVFW